MIDVDAQHACYGWWHHLIIPKPPCLRISVLLASQKLSASAICTLDPNSALIQNIHHPPPTAGHWAPPETPQPGTAKGVLLEDPELRVDAISLPCEQ